MATYQYLGYGSTHDGTIVMDTSGKLGFFGSTPIAQKAVNTIVTSVDPTVSGCAFLASVQSIAVYAASQVNKLVTALESYGLIT